MSDSRVTQLSAITEASIDEAADLVHVVDVSLSENHKMTFQELADTIIRINKAYASIYVSTAITNTANGTPAKLAGAGATTQNLVSNFTHTTPNRITYTGTETAIIKITCPLSLSHSGSNVQVDVSFAKNGTVISATTLSRTLATGDVAAITLAWTPSMATNDYIEIFSDADKSGTTTCAAAVLEATRIG